MESETAVGKKLKESIGNIKTLVEKHFDCCSKLKNRLSTVLTSTEDKIAEMKRLLILKYYGVDDESGLSSYFYYPSKRSLKHVSSKKE